MHIRILAIGHKMPSWVIDGFQEYVKRFPSPYTIELVEISAEKRTKQSDIKRLIQREGERILSMVKRDNHIIALDIQGKLWDSNQLAKNIEVWHFEGKNIDFLIGGPDGLATECLKIAQTKWSLSLLTLPHPLVRIILVEQLYRAITIIQGHPYHR